MHGIPSSYIQGILLVFYTPVQMYMYYYHLLHVHDFVQFPLRIFLLLGHMRCQSHTPDHKVSATSYCITCTCTFCDLNV